MLDYRSIRIPVQSNRSESKAGAAKNNVELDCSSMIMERVSFGNLVIYYFYSSNSLFYCWAKFDRLP